MRFRTRYEVVRHTARKHDKSIKINTHVQTFLCEICSHVLPHRQAMKRHLMKHKGERPFACDECPHKAYTEKELKVHKRRHDIMKLPEDERELFECQECMKKFTTKGGLKSHSLVHTGEKPFECSLCDKR